MLYVHSMQVGGFGVRPLKPTATTTAFYENFLNHFTSEGESKDIRNQLTWLQRLPHLATDRSDKALILALEATATAYAAIMSSNTALTQHAHDLYGNALHAHQKILQNHGTAGDITVHMVSTSVLLSFFEAMQATTADAYRAHVYGAARLLEITGPGECGHGVLCQLFYHVRTQMLLIQVATDGRPVPLAAKRILSDTLLYDDPPLIQTLMCCITALQDMRTRNDEVHESFAENRRRLKLVVDQLWVEHSTRMNLSPATESESFADAFAAVTVAYFSAAYILIEITNGSRNVSNLSQRCQVILDAASFLDTTGNAVAYMRMAMPLLLVALHASHRRHRESALAIFEGWSEGTMRGISVLALDAIHQQEQTGTSSQGLGEDVFHPSQVGSHQIPQLLRKI